MGCKRVQVYDALTDAPVMQFDSVKECAKHFGVDSAYISRNIHGGIKTICKKQYYCKAIEKVFYTDDTQYLGKRIPKAIDVYEDGELIATYDNVKLAGNATGVNPFSIYRYCRGDVKKPIRGYTFKYNTKRQQELQRTPVDLYDIDTGERYKKFDSVEECAAFLGLTPQTIRANLRGEIKTVKVRSFYCKSDKYDG